MKLEEEIQSKFRNEYHKLAVNIIYTHGWLNTFNAIKFREFGITSKQFNILRILRGQHPKSATIGLLKERMLEKIPDVSRLVDRMVNKGFLERTPCCDDRRRVNVTISKLGLNLLRQIDNADDQFDLFLKSLNIDEANTLNNLLDKLRIKTNH